MLRIIAKSLKTGVLTEAQPFGAQASFRFPVVDFSRCVACDECARSCPTGAIQTVDSAPGRKTVTLSYRLYPVPRVRERMSRAGGQRLA